MLRVCKVRKEFRPVMGQEVECFFEAGELSQWRPGSVDKTEGAKLWVKCRGVGTLGPFHRALDRNSLWRPLPMIFGGVVAYETICIPTAVNK